MPERAHLSEKPSSILYCKFFMAAWAIYSLLNFETWLSIFSTILLNSSEVAASSVDAALLSLAAPSSFFIASFISLTPFACSSEAEAIS